MLKNVWIRIIRWFRHDKPQDPPVDNTLRDLVKRRREQYREYIGYRITKEKELNEDLFGERK